MFRKIIYITCLPCFFLNYQVRIYFLSEFQYDALFLNTYQLNLYSLHEQWGKQNLKLYLVMIKYLNAISISFSSRKTNSLLADRNKILY